MLLTAFFWYLLVGLAGLAGWGVLRRLGLRSAAAWGIARVATLTAAAYGAWLAGFAGIENWWWVVVLVLAATAALGCTAWRRWERPRGVIEVEVIGLAAFLLLAWLRLPNMAVTATEKPMDLAILATLLRPGSFPPADPWLAGETLAYYYWGFLPWAGLGRLLGATPDVVFNLLVPTLAAVSAQGAWVLARALGGGRYGGRLAAFLVVFAGTPDGWRQLVSGTGLQGLDLWSSSRGIQGAITEFPLFTFHLGDLHPHLLAIPLLLAALVLARGLGVGDGVRWQLVPVVALLYGAASAANPWCALPGGLAVLAVAVVGRRRAAGLWGHGWEQWLAAITVGVLGWAAFAPFWLDFSPPAGGLGWVTTPTTWQETLFLMGGVAAALMMLGWRVVAEASGPEPDQRALGRAAWIAAAVLVGTAGGRPLVALGAAALVAAVLQVARPGYERWRSAWGLLLVPMILLVAMEMVYVKDPYGGELYRMNTVFKNVHLALTLLAVVLPVLLSWLRRRRPLVALAAAGLVVAAGVPQLSALAIRAARVRPVSWSGTGWMAPGEADVAAWLFRRPPAATLVEAVGDAYSDAARMSAGSGVPAVLGWENHQRVWRGGAIEPELTRRRGLVEELYRCNDEDRVLELAEELQVTYAVVGDIERRQYGLAGPAAVIRAGTVIKETGGCAVVTFGE